MLPPPTHVLALASVNRNFLSVPVPGPRGHLEHPRGVCGLCSEGRVWNRGLSVPSASSWAKGHLWEALGCDWGKAQLWARLSGDRDG